MIKPSPCFILLTAKFSKNCQPLSEVSPCLLKILSYKIFFGKNGCLFHRLPLASFCSTQNSAKMGSLSFRQGFPSGGSSLRSKVMRGVAHFWFFEYFGRNFWKSRGAPCFLIITFQTNKPSFHRKFSVSLKFSLTPSRNVRNPHPRETAIYRTLSRAYRSNP